MLATVTGLALRDWRFAAAGIAAGSALGSYANLAVLLRGLRARLGPLYTSAMWRGTGRIGVASAVATLVGVGVRLLLGDRSVWVVGPPALGAFALSYLLVAWAMGSAEASRWLRLPVRGDR
jgi:peptidoglycan biosynthesis protein MviN/MurJ (putative lipid II flippase)